ncbi:MAG: phosphotransferase family protein [Candidatus Thorarchaeota archaeon]|jgi:aminoglycoside phosphotransferase (APT) family kinase protein
MIEIDDYKKEIIEEIAVDYPTLRNSRMSEFKQILGGADTTIYGFDLISESKTLPLILRIYRSAFSQSARREFKILQILHVAGISVPRPYLFKEKSEATGRTYIVMERIEGSLLSEELRLSQSTPRFDQLLETSIKDLVAIHSLDWTKSFTFLDHFNITEKPEEYFNTKLSRVKRIIFEHGLDALIPVIDWMETNQVEQVIPRLLHGDYHGMNILVRGENDFVTIDWSNAHIGDFRSDIGFTVLALNSMGVDLTEHIVSLYESIAGVKVNNLDYFMVLVRSWHHG